MYKKYLILSLLIMTLRVESQNNNIVLDGEYLGQEKPGLTAKLFAPNFISTNSIEKSVFFHPNSKEFYFTREGKDALNSIMVSKLDSTGWSQPKRLPIPNRESFRAFITKDGTKMYFASIELTSEEDSRMEYNLWVMEREGEIWKNPTPLGPEINTPDALEMHPSVADNGTIYFKRFNFKDETEKVFYAEWNNGKFLSAQPLEVDFGSFTEDPFVSPDESYVIFNPSGPEKFGPMHISFKNDTGNWSLPQDMGLDGELPSLSADGRYLFFIKNDDVYWVDAEIIESFK